MKVFVNNQLTDFTENTLSLQKVLESLNISQPQGIAIAVNNQIITKSNWQSTQLKEEDKITIIRATQGG
jgi:sulfur carrier protein